MIGESFDGLVCDLDGVVYKGASAIPGAGEALAKLRDEGVRILFCTNNSRSTVSEYVDKLGRLGVDADHSEILSSAVVTAEVLKERGYGGKTAIVVGGAGIREALSDVCIGVKDEPDVVRADVVVVGLDPTFDYEAMRRAADAVRGGASLIGTNDDPTLPVKEGVWPGAGAILAAIEAASGSKAEVMGKPHAAMLDAVAARLSGCQRIAVIGDRPETDLAGAPARGWLTILALSGVTGREQVGRLTPPPDFVVESLAELAS